MTDSQKQGGLKFREIGKSTLLSSVAIITTLGILEVGVVGTKDQGNFHPVADTTLNHKYKRTRSVALQQRALIRNTASTHSAYATKNTAFKNHQTPSEF